MRAQLGRFGFSGDKATTLVGKLSGGERARLALALITRDAPHLLILDEPTNHLDVDAREALVQALNGYDGAVIIDQPRPPHGRTDRRPAGAGRTWRRAREYAGSIDDYIDFVLGRNQPKAEAQAERVSKADRKAESKSREDARALKKAAAEAEAASARLAAQCSALDRAMFDPAGAEPGLASLPMTELGRRRAKLAVDLEEAEARWLEASEQLDQLAA